MRSLCVQYVFVWESLWFWEMVKHFHFAGNWIIFYKLIRAREQAYGFLWMQKRGQLCIKQMFVCTLRHDARCFLSIFRSINLSLIVFVYKFDEWTEFRTNSTNEWIFFNSDLFSTMNFFSKMTFEYANVAYYYEALQKNYCENGFEKTTTEENFHDLRNLLI